MNCPKCDGAMWDNREKKKNPKAPDFKCKDTNCDGVVWPSRGARQSAPSSSYQRSAPKDPRGNGEDRSSRIERQHSQEMALRYAELKGLSTITTEELRKLIDWFQRDVGHVPETASKPEPRMTHNHDIADEQDSGPDDDEVPF